MSLAIWRRKLIDWPGTHLGWCSLCIVEGHSAAVTVTHSSPSVTDRSPWPSLPVCLDRATHQFTQVQSYDGP